MVYIYICSLLPYGIDSCHFALMEMDTNSTFVKAIIVVSVHVFFFFFFIRYFLFSIKIRQPQWSMMAFPSLICFLTRAVVKVLTSEI